MNKWKHGHAHGLQGRAATRSVCRRASAAEEPSATLRTSCGGVLVISAPLGMGRRPRHIYTLINLA